MECRIVANDIGQRVTTNVSGFYNRYCNRCCNQIRGSDIRMFDDADHDLSDNLVLVTGDSDLVPAASSREVANPKQAALADPPQRSCSIPAVCSPLATL